MKLNTIRLTFKAVMLLLVTAMMVGLYGAIKLRKGPELESQTLAMEGLAAPVEILYDSM